MSLFSWLGRGAQPAPRDEPDEWVSLSPPPSPRDYGLQALLPKPDPRGAAAWDEAMAGKINEPWAPPPERFGEFGGPGGGGRRPDDFAVGAASDDAGLEPNPFDPNLPPRRIGELPAAVPYPGCPYGYNPVDGRVVLSEVGVEENMELYLTTYVPPPDDPDGVMEAVAAVMGEEASPMREMRISAFCEGYNEAESLHGPVSDEVFRRAM